MDTLKLQPLLEEHFFWLHRHPELSFAEYETTAYLKRTLGAAGIEILDAGLDTGLVARLRGGAAGPVVALRADIDALPVTEATGLDYASQTAGMMHACGHDFHTAALLGAALILKENEKELQGEVRIVFQPAEERSGGAASVLATGALDGVKEIFGLHAAPDYPEGVVALAAGGTFAAVAAFKIILRGVGGHAAMPHLTRDPVAAAAALISGAQAIVSRMTDPFDTFVLSFTHIDAGAAWNVIPETALLEGTIRSLTTENVRAAALRLEGFCAAIETSHRVKAEIEWWLDSPATNNDPVLTAEIGERARALGFSVVPYTPTMAGEDFALYQERMRGVFINFGVGSPYGLHHPQFKTPPAQLHRAALLLAACATLHNKP